MVVPSSRPVLPFDRPAFYQIIVQGRVDPTWQDRFEGLAILSIDRETSPPITTLQGQLTDQAALAGVLNTLYELHLPVLSVNRLEG
jgi:hypothetical protein